jgi:N-acetyl-S-(2-succino)cysteine monooxygenase
MVRRTTMHLGAFLPAPGHHVAAWRHPQTRADGGHDLAYYAQLARTAERGLFDLMFLSDGVGIRTHYRDADELSRWGRMVHFEPLTLLSALAATTTHLGLCATASTTYTEPFHVARQFASLDHLSGGRAAWNIVTSVTDAEARNFNRERQPDHAARYARAREHVSVVRKLWDSWEDDAFLFDKAGGRFFDPSKLHVPGHCGSHFQVQGPLNVARAPQGHPVLVQAGSSDDGRAFAAEFAEVIFTAQQTFEQAKAFRDDLDVRLAAAGRSPAAAKILPGVFVVIGRTSTEARERFDQYQDLIDLKVALGLLSDRLGNVDVSTLPLDEPLPPLPPTGASKSRYDLMVEQTSREGLTVRQLAKAVAGPRGHRIVIGTPSMVADELADWFERGVVDGYNVMPPGLPADLTSFVDEVVPELQRRGVFRKAYDGATLRENLGLARPSHPRAGAVSGTHGQSPARPSPTASAP